MRMSARWIRKPTWTLTLLGRSALLMLCQFLATAACWIAAGLLFGTNAASTGLISLSVLAWTIGLRHGLDADHISAIDNATRGLISLGQYPVTCGLFFSLGHSTIVIAVICALAISTDVYDKLGGVSSVGSTVGSIISASFLFLLGMANSVILYRIIRNRKKRQRAFRQGLSEAEVNTLMLEGDVNENSIMMRILGPVTKFVDRPWKMYPVGVLFGLSFDTASSIALLAISALAKNGTGGEDIPQTSIIILPFLFTAGMSTVDSADSILMLYSYAGFPERRLHFFEKRIQPHMPLIATHNAIISSPNTDKGPIEDAVEAQTIIRDVKISDVEEIEVGDIKVSEQDNSTVEENHDERPTAKQNSMSQLSIVLTSISIVLAFSIALIEIMGVIEADCHSCSQAADDPDGGGLAGSWWRFWAEVNDNSGYIGAGIVGLFVMLVASWYTIEWIGKRRGRRGNRENRNWGALNE